MKLLLFILFLFCMPLQAHQPKLINYSPTIDNPHAVIFPEISKAYYSKLTGQPHYYVINSEDDFLFYTSILSPKINEEPSRFSLEVLDGDQNIVYKVDGLDFEWTAWYEPYARDWYWKGPEIGVESGKEFQTSFTIDAGTYYIKVFNAL